MMTMILRDFKPILDLDLYGEHMPVEQITGSVIGLNLSAGSTYTQVYTVPIKGSFTVYCLEVYMWDVSSPFSHISKV